MQHRSRPFSFLAGLALLASLPFQGAHSQATSDDARVVTLLRLTPDQYVNTMREVFGPTIQVPFNRTQPGFRGDGLLAIGERRLTITSAELARYEVTGGELAEQVVDLRRRDTFFRCSPRSEKAPDRECAASFFGTVMPLLLRRPVADSEVQKYVALHVAAGEQLASFNAGMVAALSKLLVAPDFLFRVEYGTPDVDDPSVLHLDAYSRASRLSFFLWNGPPDAQLLAAAESGALLTGEGTARQVDRMLASPRVEYGVRAFFSDMLGFDKFEMLAIDSRLFPKFTVSVPRDSEEQTLRTIVDHLLVRKADYRDLFTTRDTYLTPALAALYSVPIRRSQELGGPALWVAHRFAEDSPYVGIIGHFSFLGLNSHPARTSPTLRGKAIREKLMCQVVPPPTGEVDFSLLEDTSSYPTARLRLEAHNSEPICAGCHRITDPIGLALEMFDAAAAVRATENGQPIDLTGRHRGANFDGLQGLSQLLRDDPQITTCLVNRVFSYGAARPPTSEDRVWLSNANSTLREQGIMWVPLVKQIATTEGFYTTVVSSDDKLSASAE